MVNIKVGEEFRSWIEGLTFLILSTIFECVCVCGCVCCGTERSSSVRYAHLSRNYYWSIVKCVCPQNQQTFIECFWPPPEEGRGGRDREAVIPALRHLWSRRRPVCRFIASPLPHHDFDQGNWRNIQERGLGQGSTREWWLTFPIPEDIFGPLERDLQFKWKQLIPVLSSLDSYLLILPGPWAALGARLGVERKEGKSQSFSQLVAKSVWLFATPWTVIHQAPLSMGFSRQEYWSGLPCPPLGDLLTYVQFISSSSAPGQVT